MDAAEVAVNYFVIQLADRGGFSIDGPLTKDDLEERLKPEPDEVDFT
ncbi:MAG TPA: hypothetical protein VFB99_07850 [Vicinamibacterales bacterium]|nr:hypothetical protein [Vicinamibacterales bacterium]